MKRADVIVVGAGPVGLSAALDLARQGVSLCVIDGDPVPPDFVEGAQFPGFTAVERQPFLCGYTGAVQLFGPDGTAQHVAGVPGERFDPSGSALRALLLEQLRAFPNAEVLWDHQLRELGQRDSEARALVMTEDGDRVFEAEYILGTDGVHSTVRRTLGIAWEPLFAGEAGRASAASEPQRVLQFTVAGTAEGLFAEAISVMARGDSFAVVTKGHLSQQWHVIASDPGGTGRASKRAEAVWAELCAAYSGEDGIGRVEEASSLAVQKRVASRFSSGRILLAGDSTHEWPLWTGLGLACGLADAACVAEALLQALRGQEAEALFTQYSERRKAAVIDCFAPLVEQAEAALRQGSAGAWQALLGRAQ